MCHQSRRKEGPKHYAKISTKRRKNLVDLVIDKSYSIGRAAARLKIKLSTAKMIVKKYKESGTFFEKKFASRAHPKDVIQSSLPPQQTQKPETEQLPKNTIKHEEEEQSENQIAHQPNLAILSGENLIGNPFIFENSRLVGDFQAPQGFSMPVLNPWWFPFIFG